MTYSPNIQPLGKMGVTAAGTTTLLSVNCGPQAGATSNPGGQPPYVPFLGGRPFRQFQLTADSANTGRIFLLPRGQTATGNPGSIIDVLTPGLTRTYPFGVSDSSGYLPENFCLDTDAASGTQYTYGSGFRG